jgi:hypothetical protein
MESLRRTLGRDVEFVELPWEEQSWDDEALLTKINTALATWKKDGTVKQVVKR